MIKEKQLKKIPYGLSNYNLFREENYYYVDKTAYIRNIEDKGRFLFFIRPRRFGKSLFLSILHTYYDVNWSDRFDFFFNGTEIHRNPTPEKNMYLVLKFDFSAVDPDISKVEEAFLYYIKDTLDVFLAQYEVYLNIDINKAKEELNSRRSPSTLFNTFLKYCKGIERKILVIIDEYDNFANTILSTAGEGEYQKLTHGEGFFRAFFNVLKSGTSGPDSPILRLFMTGVSPITLDDVTSGFNIAENISLDPDIDEVLGFNREETANMIEYYRQTGKIEHPTSELLDIMSQWYNHYRFSQDSAGEVFNPVQVMYFLKEYLKTSRLPSDLIDRNVRIDYHKLRHLIVIDRKDAPQGSQIPKINGNFSKLRAIIETGSIHSPIVKGFSIDKLTDSENFISLLYYFGLLTIDGTTPAGEALLAIPNETVKRLYFDYIKETYEETQVFNLDFYTYSQLMQEMAFKGDWQPLIQYLAQRIEASISLRDLIDREKAVQTFLNVYLGLSPLYIIHSERELNKGFADLVLEPFLAQYPAIKYAYLVEIKYLKALPRQMKLDEEKIRSMREDAERQLKQYSLDEKFKNTLGLTKLIKLVLVFCGHRLVYKGEAL